MRAHFSTIRLGLVLLMLALVGGCGDPAATDPGDRSAPPAAELPEIPVVDTAGMLPGVRDQFEAARSQLLERPDDATANGRFGMLLQAYELNRSAVAAYARARSFDDDEFDWAYLHGLALNKVNETAAATAAFRRALELRPDDVRARIGLAASLAAAGEREQSVAAYRAALVADPQQLDARFGLAQQLAKGGDVEGAIVELQRLTGGARDYGPVHYALANAYRQRGDAAAVARHMALFEEYEDSKLPLTDPLQSEVQALRADARPLLEKAANYYRGGHPAQAVATYQKALEIDPDNPATHASLVGIYADLGKIDEARQHFERAIELNPELTAAHENMGTAYMKTGRMADAEQAFARVMALNPGDANAQARLGYAQELQGRFDDAQRGYRRALEIDPNQPLANFLIGRRLANTESCEAAVPYLERSVGSETDSGTAAYLLGLAQCYGKLGRLDEAFAALSRGQTLARRYRNQIVLAQLETTHAQLIQQRPVASD